MAPALRGEYMLIDEYHHHGVYQNSAGQHLYVNQNWVIGPTFSEDDAQARSISSMTNCPTEASSSWYVKEHSWAVFSSSSWLLQHDVRVTLVSPSLPPPPATPSPCAGSIRTGQWVKVGSTSGSETEITFHQGVTHEVGVENSRQWGQSNAVGAEARFGNGVSDVGFTASTAVSQEEAIIIAKYATRTEEMDITKHYNRRGWIWQWQYNIQAWNIPLCGGHTTIKTGAIELMPIDAGPPCCLPDYCVSENFCISCVNDAARLPGCTSTEEYLARIRRQQHAGFADQDTTPAVDPQPAELTRPRAEPTPPADPCRLRRLRRLRHTDSASGQASGVDVISEDSDCNQQPSAAVLESRSASHYPRVIKHLCVVITMALLAAGVAAGSRQGGNFRVALV